LPLPADVPIYVGVDLGGTKILAVVGTADGGVLSQELDETPQGSATQVVDAMVRTARNALDRIELSPDRVRGVGIACAGAINAKQGFVRHCPQVRVLDGAPLVRMFQDRWDIPSVIGNDANMAGLGEHRFGAGRGLSHLIYITVSTGIGSGIVIDGKVYEGASGYAGEFGHMTVDAHGPLGTSANPGAWESLCSGSALSRIALRRLAAGAKSSLRMLLEAEGPEAVDAVAIFAAYRNKDPLAGLIIQRAITYLGAGLTNVVNILNPGRIIIGGGLSNEWDAYIVPAIAIMRGQAFAGIGPEVDVVRAGLGANNGALGAIAFAADGMTLPAT